MPKKISAGIVLMQWMLLAAMVGFCMISYLFLFPLYYDHLKNKQIQEAYTDIAEIDLAHLEEEDYVMLNHYEDENLTFTIADENMQPVYTTREEKELMVYKNIRMKLESFSREPELIQRGSRQKEAVKLRGILTQDGRDYYVVVKDAEHGLGSTKLTEHFLLAVLAASFLLGSLILLRAVRRFSKPIEELADVADQLAERQTKKRAKEDGRYTEINRLARSINRMSDQLRRETDRIDETRKQMLMQNVNQERMEKLRKDFIANVSHELKTPLAVISSQAEMVEYVSGQEQKQYLESIQEEVQKMSGLVRRLLDVSTLEHHMENMLQKKLDMKEVLEYIVLKYDGLMKKKRLHMDVFLSEDCVIHGDREYIEQAVNNYMMNALEHTEIGGNIRITLKRNPKGVRVGVFNTGKQIPVEELMHIWNGFYSRSSEEQEDAKRYAHAGLGLYIVQSVITMHGGECGVENLPEGVEFWFTLPFAEEKE